VSGGLPLDEELALASAPARDAVLGDVLFDLRTREVVIDLRPAVTPESGINGAVAKTWIGVPTPTVVLGRRAGSARAQRVFDVTVVLLTLPLWFPLLLGLMLLVKLTSRGPALFVHTRVGRYGTMIACPKLRTMEVDADRRLAMLLASDEQLRDEFDDRFKLRRDPRVTRVGRVLRSTGLDELPQLICVLRGTMSLVGPRPIVPDETMYYGRYLELMQSTRPGCTGLWQVSGRNDLSYAQRVAYDVEYVLTRTVWRDVKILFATLRLVCVPKRRGGY